MPPPIVPASGPPNRATVTRLTEKVPQRPSPIPDDPAAASAAAAAMEPRARPPAANLAAASPASPPARPAAKTPSAEGAPKFGEVRPLGDKPNAASSVKTPAKVDDPFADLDSLEAEMARLLGREKLS
jgi:flagellar protein FliO/FliZ